VLDVGSPAPRVQRRPVSGPVVDSEEVLRQRPIALVFLRYAGSAHTRAVAKELDAAWDQLDPDVLLVGVVEGSERAARDVVPRLHLRFPVLHDADGTLYSAYQVGSGLPSLGGLLAYPETLRAGHGWPEGPFDRAMAAFVLGKGGAVAWAWYGRRSTDRPDVGELVRQARSAA
jgi:peroxiredoxin